jgi:hypothetical protein
MVEDTLTLERLDEILDAYGAEPSRWPEAELAAALALLERSPEARARRAAAARLDSVLALAPAAVPSAELVAQVLAARGGGRAAAREGRWSRTRRWGSAAAAVAVAAGVALWLVRDTPPVAAPDPQVVAQLGVYATPTDVLLSATDLVLLDGAPDLGCAEPGLGCLDLEPLDEGRSGKLMKGRHA